MQKALRLADNGVNSYAERSRKSTILTEAPLDRYVRHDEYPRGEPLPQLGSRVPQGSEVSSVMGV